MSSQGWTLQDWTLRDEFTGVDIAGLDVDRQICWDEQCRTERITNCTTLVILSNTANSMQNILSYHKAMTFSSASQITSVSYKQGDNDVISSYLILCGVHTDVNP